MHVSKLLKKLRIKPSTTIVAINAPADYTRSLGRLPAGVSIAGKSRGPHPFIHLFVRNKAQLQREIIAACKSLEPDGLIWISYPKSRSGMQSDLTRDRGWEILQKLDMQHLSLISFTDDWSAFLLKNSPARAPGDPANAYAALQAQWIDTTTKRVRLPVDLAAAMKKDRQAGKAFDALSFTNRKEYVLWVVGAKRDVTRQDRIKSTLAKLRAGKKNPADK